MTGLLDAEDVHSTRRAVEALGATVRPDGAELLVVPPEALREPGDVIDCGNSGTSLRLLTGVLSGIPGLSVLTGDASLRRRPVRRVIEPLRRMGANLSARDGDRLPPVVVRGGALRGAHHVLEVASAQVKSACLLAGLFADGETTVTEPERSRDHTERMLRGMGVPVRTEGLTVSVGPSRPRGGRVDVPGDISSAAFFLCAAAATPGSQVTVRGLGVNPTRTGLLDVLAAMGAAPALANEREVAGEPRADVTVSRRRAQGDGDPRRPHPPAHRRAAGRHGDGDAGARPDRHPRREGAAGEGVGPARGDGRDARRRGCTDRALRGRLRDRRADAAARRHGADPARPPDRDGDGDRAALRGRRRDGPRRRRVRGDELPVVLRPPRRALPGGDVA